MAGAAVRIDHKQVDYFVDLLINLGKDPAPLLRKLGAIAVSQTKARFQDASKRRRPWPKKWRMFEIWEGNRTVPLTSRGHLKQSISWDIRGGRTLRVGSPLRYAATHQFGDNEPRAFYLWIKPEYEDGIRGKRIKRDPDTGYPIGKMSIGRGHGKNAKPTPDAVRVLVRLNSIRPRPFLENPDEQEWQQVATVIEQHIAKASGMPTGGLAS